MPIPASCSCGKQVTVPDKYAGQKVRCPSCGQPIRVPAGNASSPSVESSGGGQIAAKCRCGRTVGAKPSLAGKTVKCPACGQPLRIPSRQIEHVGGPSDAGYAEAAPKPPGGLDDLLDEVGLSDGSGSRCGNCRAEMPEGAVVCVQCGYDARVGRKRDTKRPVTAKDRLAKASQRMRSGPKKSGATWFLPVVVCGLFMVAAVVWRFSPEASALMVFIVASIAMSVGWIWLVIVAFHVSPLEGLLCLAVPLYSLVFAVRHWNLSKAPFILQLCGLLGFGYYFS